MKSNSKKIIKAKSSKNTPTTKSFKSKSMTNCALVDIKNDVYMYSYYVDGGYRREIHMYNLDSISLYPPQSLSLENAESYLSQIKEAAPVDLQVFFNGQTIADDAKKSELIDGLGVFEYKNTQVLSFKKMTAAMKETSRLAGALRTKLQNHISCGAINSLSPSAFKKLSKTLEELSL